LPTLIEVWNPHGELAGAACTGVALGSCFLASLCFSLETQRVQRILMVHLANPACGSGDTGLLTCQDSSDHLVEHGRANHTANGVFLAMLGRYTKQSPAVARLGSFKMAAAPSPEGVNEPNLRSTGVLRNTAHDCSYLPRFASPPPCL